MSSRPEMEAAIRAACQKAHGQSKAAVRIDLEEDCGLADVLAALGKAQKIPAYCGYDEKGLWFTDFCRNDNCVVVHWNPSVSLSNQTDETVSDIYQILQKNNAN